MDDSPSRPRSFEPLSPREREVLVLLAENLSDRAIAERLVIARTTVKWYNRQIFNKLGVEGRQQAVEYARSIGLLGAVGEPSAPRHPLPAQVTPFVGRTQELSEVSQWLSEPNVRLITILAPGGMGKTRLALQAAEAALAHYGDGVCFVPLAGLTSPDLLITTLAEARGVKQMQVAFEQHLDANEDLHSAGLSVEQRTKLHDLEGVLRAGKAQVEALDSITRSDRESELERSLENSRVQDSWIYAPALVEMGFKTSDIGELADVFSTVLMQPVLAWLVSGYAMTSLLQEISEGTRRISDIVTALKSYTYLDQAPVQNVNIHEALDNTLVMFSSQLTEGIVVRREYAGQLPIIEAYGSELNQVWTNIIDNALAAMKGAGEITLRTRREGHYVIVEIADTGPGIPEAIRARVFDPFFTTKAPGEGTGLGLNISHNIVVQKHKGEITVISQPGSTCFQVKLPLTLGQPEP